MWTSWRVLDYRHGRGVFSQLLFVQAQPPYVVIGTTDLLNAHAGGAGDPSVTDDGLKPSERTKTSSVHGVGAGLDSRSIDSLHKMLQVHG